MENKIKYTRLYAFFNSKTLNVLMMTIITSLFIILLTDSLALPAICGSIAMVCFIAYALWLWIKKPRTIVVNTLLSNISSAFTFYFVIIVAARVSDRLFFVAPIILFVVVLFIASANYRDRIYDV